MLYSVTVHVEHVIASTPEQAAEQIVFQLREKVTPIISVTSPAHAGTVFIRVDSDGKGTRVA